MSAASESPFRRDTIRFRRLTLTVLVAVVGVVSGLIGRDLYLGMRQQQQIAEVQRRNGLVYQRIRTVGVSNILARLGVRLGFLDDTYSAEVNNVVWVPQSAEDLDLLHAFPELTQITLKGATVTDAALANLVGLGQLQSLTLVEAAITEQGLKTLLQLPGLRSLTFRECSSFTGESFPQLPGLRSLSLWGCPEVTAELILAIREANPALRVSVTSAGTSLPPMQDVPKEIRLSFDGPLATDATLVATLKHARNVTALSFNHCGVTDDGLRSLGSLSQLTSLHLLGHSPPVRARSDPRVIFFA